MKLVDLLIAWTSRNSPNKSLRITQNICNGAVKWTQTRVLLQQVTCKATFQFSSVEAIQAFSLYLIESPFAFPISHMTVTWDHALKQEAQQITEHKLLEKLVQVDNEKCTWNQFSERRYWEQLFLKKESSLLFV